MFAQIVSRRCCRLLTPIVRTGVNFTALDTSTSKPISKQKNIRPESSCSISNGFVDRMATMADKDAILAINENVYGGKDYLADYFDYFMDSPHTLPVVGELDGTIIVFLACTFVDGGQKIVGRSERIRREYEGQGFYPHRFIEATFSSVYGCGSDGIPCERAVHPRAETSAHCNIMDASREELREGLVTSLSKFISEGKQKVLGVHDMLDILDNKKLVSHLFPRNRIIVDLVPYRLQPGNVNLFFGRNTVFLSDVNSNGLLSGCALYKSKSPSHSAIIDVFGSNLDTLDEHLATHFLRIGSAAKQPFYIEIVTDASVPTETVDKQLSKYKSIGLRFVETRSDYLIEEKL